MDRTAEAPLDCVVIGGGPAGLTAAIYLARFHLSFRLIDGGDSRAALIPCTHNHAGYPGGIAGTDLLDRMRTQAEEYGSPIVRTRATGLAKDGDLFTVTADDARYQTRSVLLATGVVNNRPNITDDDHDAALRRGLLRYCPICDGYEVTDRKVGVIGRGAHGFNEAKFLRMYTRDVTLISPDADTCLSPEHSAELERIGVEVSGGPCGRLRIDGEYLVVPTPGGDQAFESVYPALGSVIRSDLARPVGASMSDDGCLEVDDHQRTTIPGLYAAGDVVKGLDQISHAMGEGGVAATTIRNDLAERNALLR